MDSKARSERRRETLKVDLREIYASMRASVFFFFFSLYGWEAGEREIKVPKKPPYHLCDISRSSPVLFAGICWGPVNIVLDNIF